VLVVVPKNEKDMIMRVTNNLSKIDVVEAGHLNALSVISRKNILIFKDAIDIIEKTFI
jgi:ribosomal protein L4